MSKVITLAPATGSTITMVNSYTPQTEEEKNLALSTLQTVKDNEVWNTGLAMLKDPHIDELENSGKVLLTDPNAWLAKHIAAVRMYRSNEYTYLLPGDTLTITARSSEEALYYWGQKSDLLTVTCDFVTEGEDRVDEGAFVAPEYLDRTTGIGDSNGLTISVGEDQEEQEEETPADPAEPSNP